MKLNKEEFLQSELGQSLKGYLIEWDRALDDLAKYGFGTPDYNEAQKNVFICSEMWVGFRMALKYFCGVDYHFTRTDDYFGVCTNDGKDWLFKIDRHTGKEVAAPDVAEMKVKITADTTELQEGIAELEALPLIEHKPQMPEEKKKLVGLLMDFVKKTVNTPNETNSKTISALPRVAEVLAGLVN